MLSHCSLPLWKNIVYPVSFPVSRVETCRRKIERNRLAPPIFFIFHGSLALLNRLALLIPLALLTPFALVPLSPLGPFFLPYIA